MKNISDLFYVQQAKAGDVRAFSNIVCKYRSMIWTLVAKIVNNREDAEDITQEIFIKVFQSLEQFREESEFSTWLYRVAYNTALSEMRKRKLIFTSYDTDNSTAYEEISDAIFEQEKEEQLGCLDKALKQLSPDDAFLITLFYMDNQTIEKISAITELSVANVKVKLHRIRKKLAVEINKWMQQ